MHVYICFGLLCTYLFVCIWYVCVHVWLFVGWMDMGVNVHLLSRIVCAYMRVLWRNRYVYFQTHKFVDKHIIHKHLPHILVHQYTIHLFVYHYIISFYVSTQYIIHKYLPPIFVHQYIKHIFVHQYVISYICWPIHYTHIPPAHICSPTYYTQTNIGGRYLCIICCVDT